MLSDPYDASQYIPEVGDRVKVKRINPFYGGRVGTVQTVSDYGVSIIFDEGDTVTVDEDELRLIEK